MSRCRRHGFWTKLERIPDDLQNYALKPLYSFAGLGVVIAPTKEDIEAIPAEKRAEYILQERLHFEPVIETPFGGTKAEVRVMYVWLEELQAVLTIIRMGRGLMMGVDHNRNMEWVGASAGLWVSRTYLAGHVRCARARATTSSRFFLRWWSQFLAVGAAEVEFVAGRGERGRDRPASTRRECSHRRQWNRIPRCRPRLRY